MNKLIYLLFYISFSVVFAQNSKRIIKNAEILDNHTLKITVNDGVYKIIPYSTNIIETTFIPNGEAIQKESHAVILKPKKIDVSFKEKADHFVLKTL